MEKIMVMGYSILRLDMESRFAMPDINPLWILLRMSPKIIPRFGRAQE